MASFKSAQARHLSIYEVGRVCQACYQSLHAFGKTRREDGINVKVKVFCYGFGGGWGGGFPYGLRGEGTNRRAGEKPCNGVQKDARQEIQADEGGKGGTGGTSDEIERKVECAVACSRDRMNEPIITLEHSKIP